MIQGIKNILAPIDFSDYSMEAMRGALELAQEVDANVHIVHVVAHHFAIFEKSREQARETLMLEEAEEELARLKQDNLATSPRIFTHAVIGHPVKQLVDYAKEKNIDLIMLANQGQSGPEHHLLGGLAERLARVAPCSILIFRRRA